MNWARHRWWRDGWHNQTDSEALLHCMRVIIDYLSLDIKGIEYYFVVQYFPHRRYAFVVMEESPERECLFELLSLNFFMHCSEVPYASLSKKLVATLVLTF